MGLTSKRLGLLGSMLKKVDNENDKMKAAENKKMSEANKRSKKNK